MERLTASRREVLAARLADAGGYDGWGEVLGKIALTPGLLASGNGWSITFDWLLHETNFAKVTEGAYDHTGTPPLPVPPTATGCTATAAAPRRPARAASTRCSRGSHKPSPPLKLKAMIDAGALGGGWLLPATVRPDVAASLPEAIADAEAALRPASPREAAVVLGRLAALLAPRPPARASSHHLRGPDPRRRRLSARRARRGGGHVAADGTLGTEGLRADRAV